MVRPLFLAPTLVVAMLLASACFGGSADDEPTPAATATTQPGATATAVPPSPTTEPSPTPPPIEVTGLFDEPGDSVVPGGDVTLPERTPPTFPELPVDNTILYDTQTMTATDLGPGTIGQFSPDGRYMAWVADSKVQLLDLETGDLRTLGDGFWVQGLSNRKLITGNGNTAYDLETGTNTTVQAGPTFVNLPNAQGDLSIRLVEGSQVDQDTYLFVVEREHADGTWTPVLEVRAYWVRFGAPGELILATATQSEREDSGSIPFASGTRNLFTVDIATGVATFVATVSTFGTTPFSASERYISWTEDFCADDPLTVLLERETGTATRILGGSWIDVTPTNLIADGWGFGALALIDPETLEYRAVLSSSNIDVRWSADYRYATTGFRGGHGGHCGG